MISILLPEIPSRVLADVEDLLDANGLRYVVERPNPGENKLGPFTKKSDTSRRAALKNYPKSGSQRWRVLRAIRDSGEQGMTRDELAHFLQLPDSSVDGRVWELKQGDWAIDSEQTRTTQSGGEAHALVLSLKALMYFRSRDT